MRSPLRSALVAALSVSLLGTAAATAATAAPANDGEARITARSTARGPDAAPLLPRRVQGKAAVKALGTRLPEAAATNGMTSTELRQVLATDRTATVYPTGQLAYTDTFERVPETEHPRAQTLLFPTTDTFTRHSRPSSKHTIYLDFTGAFVGGTLWNEGSDAIPARTYQRFSLDNDFSSTYSTAEHEYIQNVWRYISETYAAFDVDVTTQDSGDPGDYNRGGGGDDTYGDHVLFSDDPVSDPICDPDDGCGGVAFISTFNDPDDNDDYLEPAWVRTFPSAFSAAMAASHEIGHTLGLRHDGTVKHGSVAAEGYYEGQGEWTPIMGAGGNAVHQFSNGDYKYANNKQDDFASIVANGLPRLYDEAGNTVAAATTLGTNDTTVPGVITSRTDADYYKIGPCTTAPSVRAVGNGLGSSLDLRTDLLRADGTLDTFSNPSTASYPGAFPNPGLDTSTISGSSGAGTYVVKVDGVGAGSATSTGYSDYGSIGSYALTVSGCVAAPGALPGAPTAVDVTSNKAAGTVTWTAPAVGAPVLKYRITGVPGGPVEVGGSTTSKAVSFAGGTDVNVRVVALSAAGASPAGETSPARQHIDSWAPTTAPTVRYTTKGKIATISWSGAANPGGASIDHWLLKIGSQTLDPPIPATMRSVQIQFGGYGTFSSKLTPVYYTDNNSKAPGRAFTLVVAAKPKAPKIGRASSGAKGGSRTATARWSGAVNNGAAIKTYQVYAYRLTASNKVATTYKSKKLTSSARSYSYKLPAGRYKFRVLATNSKGTSPLSGYSGIVTAR